MDHEDFVVRRRTRWYTHVGDFMNTLKAFIGTNYQGLPFAFANSGLAFGWVGVFAIATLTDHCCQILIRCKVYIIEKTIKQQLEKEKISESDIPALHERLQLTIGYGDVAMRVYGAWCFHLTQAAICFTQFMVCVMYFVFIANTIAEIYPMQASCNTSEGAPPIKSMIRVKTERGGSGIPMLHIPSLNLSARYRRSASTCNSSCKIALASGKNPRTRTDLKMGLMSLGEKEEPPVQDQRISGESINSKYILSRLQFNGTDCPPENVTLKPTAPDLRLVVLFPLPIFVFTSLIRNVRYLAPMSSIATAALIGGAVSVLVFLIKDFQIGQFDWYKVTSLPLFFCQLTAAFEGIGCILPIQSSMVGCRHLFPAYIHATVYIIFVILSAFGTLGYLSYGDAVKQMIVLEIPQHTMTSVAIDITLIISVVFTYPLQCYPVIEIMESAILLPSQCCKKKNTVEEAKESSSEGPKDELIESKGVDFSVHEVSGTVVPSTIPLWKRNIIRMCVTLVIAALAVILREYFAYISALGGALGASYLAFVLPCLIDIRLRAGEMSLPIKIKNIIIIITAITFSILGLIVIVMQMVKAEKGPPH